MTTETLICQKFTAKQAIFALITGLDKALSGTYNNFELSMGTFGNTDGTICYGCAATVALQELTGHIFKPDTYINEYYVHGSTKAIDSILCQTGGMNRESAESYDITDVREFEHAVNYFRLGQAHSLYEYFNEPIPEVDINWSIHINNIESELPKIKEFYNKLPA